MNNKRHASYERQILSEEFETLDIVHGYSSSYYEGIGPNAITRVGWTVFQLSIRPESVQ